MRIDVLPLRVVVVAGDDQIELPQYLSEAASAIRQH
jgi:hypothetical protein